MADDVIANEDEKMVAEMHMLAKLALRTDQAVYNVNTGLCIVPDVNGDGELFGAQYTHTSLDVLLSAGSNGLPESALEYTMSYYPASGTAAANRLDAIYELEEGIYAYDDDLEKTNSLPQMIDMMVANGKGWCLPLKPVSCHRDIWMWHMCRTMPSRKISRLDGWISLRPPRATRPMP